MDLFDEFENIVRENFVFLTDEFGFGPPEIENIGQRYRHVSYKRNNLRLEFAIEAPDSLPWWTAVRLIDGNEPSGYGIDESGRKRRLYPHEIIAAIREHVVGEKPTYKDKSLTQWALTEREYLQRYIKYFLENSDKVFEKVDHDRKNRAPGKLP
jgi:hypothetical protein